MSPLLARFIVAAATDAGCAVAGLARAIPSPTAIATRLTAHPIPPQYHHLIGSHQ